MNKSRATIHRHSPLLILLFGLWIQLSAFSFNTLNANTLTLNTSGDANIQGANLHTTEATNLNIGGDLEVASLQDKNSHNSVGIDTSVGFSTDTNKQGDKTGQTTTASANYNSSNGNYIAVTNQTSITSDGKVNIDTKGNTHLTGALIEGETATSITTATLTTEDIHNRADYNAMSVGASYTHSTSPDKTKDNGIKPNIGLPQDVDKSSTTHTAIADNTVINITDKDKQTEDTSKISRDTEHASYTMTEINTEVLDIRAGISQDLSKDGFKAVGDLAMREGWEDGSIEKTLAHAAMGAVVATVGNGDALGGALGAGAAELARPTTADTNDATQQTVSTLVGAIAGGGTGASTGLDGEKFNRQLHQREIAWIEQNAAKYAALHDGMTPEQAKEILAKQGMRNTDTLWSGMYDENEDAQAFMEQNSDGTLFQATQAEKDNFMQNIGTFSQNTDFYNNIKKDATVFGLTVHTANANDLASKVMITEIARGNNAQEGVKALANMALQAYKNGDKEKGREYLDALASGYSLGGSRAVGSAIDLAKNADDPTALLTELAAGGLAGRAMGRIPKAGMTKPKVDINDPKSFNGKSAAEIDKELKEQGYEVGTYRGTSNGTVYTKTDANGQPIEVIVNNGGGIHTGGKPSDNPVYVKINKPNVTNEKIIVDKDKYEIPNTPKKLREEDRSVNVIDGETGKPIAPKKTSYDDMDKNPNVPFELKNKTENIKVIVPTEK